MLPPANLVRLKCGCYRDVHIDRPDTYPTKPSSLEHYLRRVYAVHNLPKNFYNRIQSLIPTLHIPFLSLQKPDHFNDYLDELRLPTSPGLYAPYRTKTECLNDRRYVNFMRDYAHRIKDEKDKRLPYRTIPSRLCTTPGAKLLADGTVKTRYVCVAPLPELAIENMFIRPFLRNLPADYVQKPETHHHKYCGRRTFGTDLKSSDTSMPQALVALSLSVIRSRLNLSVYSSGDVPYSSTSLDRLWRHYVKYVLNTPVEVNGAIHYFNDGIPSGILATNLLTSICGVLVHLCAHLPDCKYDLSQYGDNSIIANCRCGFENLKRAFSECGLYLKYEPPNEHGCVTYCKAECHLSDPFHPGLWYANILNCVQGRYRDLTAFCLLYTKPHPLQAAYLLTLAKNAGLTKLHQRWSYYWYKFVTYAIGADKIPL